MRHSFSHTLLITCLIIATSCRTVYVPASVETQNISISDALNQLDSQLVQVYLPYKTILEKDINRVISFSEQEMVKGKPESKLTNFLGDIVLEEAGRIAQKLDLGFIPQISFYNYGGIRTALPAGDITVGKVFELMPFENELVFLQLSGAQVQEFFDWVAEKKGESIGGARFVISNEKAKNVTVQGKELVPTEKYWIATNDYVAEGNDGLEVFTRNLQLINTGEKIRDVIIAHLERMQKNGNTLKVELDGRIKYE